MFKKKFPCLPPSAALVLGALLFLPASTLTADQPKTSSVAVPSSINGLLAESQRIEANEPQKAVTLSREALALAQAQRHRLAELRARIRLSDALRVSSNYKEAAAIIDAGLALAPHADERLERAVLIYGSAQVFWNQGDYARAERGYVEAQGMAEALGDKPLLIRCLNSRGIVARHQKDYAQAAKHWRAGLALADAANETTYQLQIQNNFGIMLTEQGELDEARRLFTANLATHTTTNNRRSIANAIINLATVETSAGNHPLALDYRLRALALRQELGIPRHIASAQIALATSLTTLDRAAEALGYLRVAQPAVEKLASHELWANFYRACSGAHAARDEFREALDFQRKAEKENELVAGEKATAIVAELRERFDAEKRSREIAELRRDQQAHESELALREAALQRVHLQRYGLVGALVLGGITVSAVIGRQRARSRAEKIILEETRRARDAAEQATQLKSRLLDLASHDLKAPLIGVMLTADTLADETADRPATAERAHALRHESQRMFNLVQALLDSSAAETGGLALQRVPLDLAELANDAVRNFTPRAEHKAQKISFSVESGEACVVRGDAGRLRQAIDNLIDNALKFSPRAATIAVIVRGGAEAVRFSVRDAGPGLSAADQQALFQRFRRLSATPTGGESSSGLGLALAHDLVIAHGGKLWAESTPGAGATFIAEFPADTAVD